MLPRAGSSSPVTVITARSEIEPEPAIVLLIGAFGRVAPDGSLGHRQHRSLGRPPPAQRTHHPGQRDDHRRGDLKMTSATHNRAAGASTAVARLTATRVRT